MPFQAEGAGIIKLELWRGEMKKTKREKSGLPCVARSWLIRSTPAIAAALALLRMRLEKESYDSNEFELGQTPLFYARTIHLRKSAGEKLLASPKKGGL